MTETRSAFPRTLAEAERLPAERVLLLVAGLSAVGLGVLAYLAGGIGRAPGAVAYAGEPLVTLVVTLLFGILLLYSFHLLPRNATEGAVLAIAFSVVLLIAGNAAGLVGGVLGVMGATLSLVRKHGRSSLSAS